MNNYFYNNGTQNNHSRDDDVSNHERPNGKRIQKNSFYGNSHEGYRSMDNINYSKPYGLYSNGVDNVIYRTSQAKHPETQHPHPFMMSQEKMNFFPFKNNESPSPSSFDLSNENSYGHNKKINLQNQYNKYAENLAYGNRKPMHTQQFYEKSSSNMAKNNDSTNILDLDLNDMYDPKFIAEDEAIINPRNIFNENPTEAQPEKKTNSKDLKIENQPFVNFVDRKRAKEIGNNKFESDMRNPTFVEENIRGFKNMNKKGTPHKMTDLPKFKDLKRGNCRMNLRKDPFFARIPVKSVFNQKILPFDENSNNSFNIYPQSSSLLVSPYRTQMIHNMSPDFFRIPQPRNNSCFMSSRLVNHSFYKLPKIDTSFSGYHHPKNKQSGTKIKRPMRKCIVLRIDFLKLYDFRIVDCSNLHISPHVNERNFILKVNEFNASIGLLLLPLKYLVSLSFIFNEIKRHKGFFNVKPGDWEKISQVVKNLAKIKEIYFFLVYPFEQIYLGINRVRVFENKEILSKISEDFKKFSVNDIEFCIIKGNIKDIDTMLSSLDPNIFNTECALLILNLFVDMHTSRVVGNVKQPSSTSALPFFNCDEKCCNGFSGLKKYEYYKNKDFNTENRSTNDTLGNRLIKKLSTIETQKFIEMSKKCIELVVEYGKICIAKYRLFDIDQEFLNKVLNILMKYKEDGYFEWDHISSFINNCYKSFFRGEIYLYMYLRKLCVKNPFLSVRIMSNIKFSKNKTKRLLRRLKKYVLQNLEEFESSMRNHLLKDSYLNFDRVQPYIFKMQDNRESNFRILSLINGSLILDDKGVLEYIVNAFYSLKGMKERFKSILLLILRYCDYNYKNKIYIKKKGSSDLFKIIARLILFKDIRDYVYLHEEITKSVKEIPGLKELVYKCEL